MGIAPIYYACGATIDDALNSYLSFSRVRNDTCDTPNITRDGRHYYLELSNRKYLFVIYKENDVFAVCNSYKFEEPVRLVYSTKYKSYNTSISSAVDSYVYRARFSDYKDAVAILCGDTYYFKPYGDNIRHGIVVCYPFKIEEFSKVLYGVTLYRVTTDFQLR